MSQVFVAKVKNVISGDTVVLVPSKTTQFPAPERILTLSYVRSEDYAGKQYLRDLLIGKEIKFKVNYKNPTTGKEFGDIQAPIFKSLIAYLLEKGLVKLKDNFSESEGDIYDELKEIEDAARRNQVGLWAATQEKVDLVELSDSVIQKSQKYPLTLIVEKVISGDRLMARIIVNKNQHVTTPLLLAGLKTPRTDDVNQSAVEQKVAKQAKQFVEDKLLTTKADLTVSIIGESQSGVPIGVINHSSGNNIHEKILDQGFGEIVDWQSSLIGSTTMATLRKADQTAKALGKGLYANAAPVKAASAGKLRAGVTLDVQIAKIINVDSLQVRLPQSDEEVTVQLASVRGPRPNDTTAGNQQTQQALVATAREFVREKAIGKTASLYVEGYREANTNLNLDGRFLVSIKINNQDLSELIVSNGWASVIRHNKATSHERSINWDKFLEIEEEAKKSKKGMYAADLNKVLTVGTRIIDTSENLAKAKTFFNGFKQKGRVGGYYVEYVASGTRVKLFNPKEGLKLNLILGGLANNKDTPTSETSIKYLNKKYLQRNVEFEIYDTDKIGNFIGNVYANSNALKPVQVQLLEQGLVKLHENSIHINPAANELIKGEDAAKGDHKGLWKDYDPAKEEAALEANQQKLAAISLESAKPKIFDGEVVDIDEEGTITFHYLDQATISKFQNFQNQFQQFHQQSPSASANSPDLPYNLSKAPKKGEIVSAKFENGKYYRARVIGYEKSSGKYKVKHLDYGNDDNVPLSSLRALPGKFNLNTYPIFAHTTSLRNVKLPPSNYLTESLYALEDLLFDKKLVFEAYASNTEYDSVIYDSTKVSDPNHSINQELVSEGWGIVTQTPSKPEYLSALTQTEKKAKASHLGCWEFGDVSFEEEEL